MKYRMNGRRSGNADARSARSSASGFVRYRDKSEEMSENLHPYGDIHGIATLTHDTLVVRHNATPDIPKKQGAPAEKKEGSQK